MRLKENEIIDELINQKDNLLPLRVKKIDQQPSGVSNDVIDAIIEFSFQDGSSFKAAVGLLTLSTPKILSQKSKLLANVSIEYKKQKCIPMIIAPYISKKQSTLLLDEGISWIDLSGNMLIKVLPNIYIERTGVPNKFPDTSPIKKIYQGVSSLVPRALLLQPEGFSLLSDIVTFINTRNGAITLATVSKVLTLLEDDLLVEKTKSKIIVKQPKALLENLSENYADYSKYNKIQYNIERVNDLTAILSDMGIDYAYGGFYAAQLKGLGITDQITVFVKSIQDVKKAFKLKGDIGSIDEEYGQVTFIETKDPCVLFNVQKESFGTIIDDLELYLEMVNDMPRGPKIAKQLKERIIGKFNG